MYTDPSGKFAISTFLIMFAVSALATWAAGEIFGHQLIGGIGLTMTGANTIYTGAGRAFSDFHYAAYGISRYDSLSNLKSPLEKVASYIGYGLIAVDVGLDIYNSIQQGYSFEKGLTSAGLTLGKDLLVMGVSSKVGGFVGAFATAKLGAGIGVWAGPVGLIVGVGVGFVIGYVVNEYGDVIVDEILGWFN